MTFEKTDDPCAQGAIVIRGITCDRDGVKAEYRWLSEHYPGYAVVHNGLETSIAGSGCRSVFDSFTLESPAGEQVGITFEISSFYAKYENCS